MTSDIARLRSLRAALKEMERPGFGFSDDQAVEETRSDIKIIEDEWTDERLVDAHRATGGESGDAEADARLNEIERRQLNI